MLTKPLGIDPSYTGCGVSCGKDTIVIQTSPSETQTTSQNCQRRAQEIIAKIVAFVNKNYDPDDILCIMLEGPSFGSSGHIFECGWLYSELYNRLISMVNRPATICEIPPGTLKRWTTGNGGPDKDKLRMKAAVKERWGVEFEMDKKGDKTDAFALYKYGVAIIEGDVEFKPTARRGQGKKQKAKRKATAKKNEKIRSAESSPKLSSKSAHGSGIAGKDADDAERGKTPRSRIRKVH